MRVLSLIIGVLLAITLAPTAQADTPAWVIANRANPWELGGYSVGESLLPGEPLQLKIDGTGSEVSLHTFRMGHYDGAGAALIAEQHGVPLRDQPRCTIAERESVDCSAWSVTHTFDTAGWEPGLYLTLLTDDLGRQHYVATVLRSPSHAGKVAIMSATTTHAAYNDYGGYSLYRGIGEGTDKVAYRAYTVSLNRPSRDNGADKVFGYELGLIQHLESLGLELSYTTNAELHRGAAGYRGAKALVALGHDEYWTVPMRDAATTLRDQGINLVFLGANTSYYRTRWNDDYTKVTSYKLSNVDPIQTRESTGTFRSEPYPDPEERLLGSQYTCYGARNLQTDLVVTNPGFWAFAGTGAAKGSRYPMLVGHEIDKAGPDSPKNVHIAAHSPYTCTTGAGLSDITYYTAPSGAGVLNLGTMGFAYALTPGSGYPAESVAFVKKVVATIATEAAAGPLGQRHTEPANYLEFYPPAPPPPPFDVYTTPGEHFHNGRRWRTACEPYSQTSRCRTDIWATTVAQVGARFVQTTGWAFNNLTYPPLPRSAWAQNPLGYTGSFTRDGRSWRTECDTPATGKNGCRSYILASYIDSSLGADGNRRFQWTRGWLFNNMARFS